MKKIIVGIAAAVLCASAVQAESREERIRVLQSEIARETRWEDLRQRLRQLEHAHTYAIDVHEDAFHVGGREVARDRLIRELRALPPEASVAIRAPAEVSFRRVVEALEVVRRHAPAGNVSFATGDAQPPPSVEAPIPDSVEELEAALSDVGTRIRNKLDARNFHGALRLLPREAMLWDRLIEKTGRSYEGAQGFLHGSVMGQTASFGDLHWGMVLDDPDIPHAYKVAMVFEILEARLGRGSVYYGNRDNLIVPVPRRLDFEQDHKFRLPEGAIDRGEGHDHE